MIKTSYSIPTNYEGHFVSERIIDLLLWVLHKRCRDGVIIFRLCIVAVPSIAVAVL